MLPKKRLNKGKGIALGFKEGLAWAPRAPSRATIRTLPDDILLEIFDFLLGGGDLNLRLQLLPSHLAGTEWWHSLVHVCRRWRHVVFASPHRLNLQLRCTEFTPVRKTLDAWPALPLIVACTHPLQLELTWDVGGADNIVAALEHNDRVRRINLRGVRSSLLGRFVAVMQRPFPALTSLNLQPRSNEKSAQVLPDSFLGEYAPRLQELSLPNIPIPVFLKLPVSSPHLADLHLWKISYIPSEMMTNCLSALPKLRTLILGFHSPLHPSRTDQTSLRPFPLTHFVLPFLTSLQFKGVSEYLEELLSRIDIPLLEAFSVTFFNQLIFDVPQLSQIISRTEKFKSLNQASVVFHERSVNVRLTEKRQSSANHGQLDLEILCTNPDWQLSSVAQVCSSSLHYLSTLEDLRIYRDCYLWTPRWPDDMESTQWLELLHPFTTVENLHVSNELAPHVALALEDLPGERATEVIPALEHLFLADFPRAVSGGSIQETVKQFTAARLLFGHPVTVHRWNGRYH